jgi:hypothetical protein
MRASFLFCLVLLATLAGPLPAAAADTSSLRISLIHGQNDLITDNLADCQKFRESLIKLFGYQRYERLGSAAAIVPQGGEATIQPTWAFQMKVRSDSTTKNLYHYELFQEEKHLLGGKFMPKDRIPFIIRGPQYNQGILILVVYKDDPQLTHPNP